MWFWQMLAGGVIVLIGEAILIFALWSRAKPPPSRNVIAEKLEVATRWLNLIKNNGDTTSMKMSRKALKQIEGMGDD